MEMPWYYELNSALLLMSGIAPVQKGVAKVAGLVLVAPRHPLQVKVELNIGDHGKAVHLIASVEEARILRNEIGRAHV